MGKYVSSFSFKNYRERFEWDVYSRLTGLLETLRSEFQEGNRIEAQAAAEIHKNTIMIPFFNHSTRNRVEAFTSHSTCLSCLFEPPEHALPCGHVLCTTCIRAYGHAKGKTVVEMDGCPLESISTSRYLWRIFLKPPTAGVRILTLDG